MKKLTILLLIILLESIVLFGVVIADTGTYVVEKQQSTLTIQTSGDVTIDYYIKMRVTGGNIPWVTVGLPNSNYEIKTFSGATKSVRKDNQGSWAGVYVELDKKYLTGESFAFSVQVTQKSFVKKYNQNASIQFTPVWWDNAITENLIIKVVPPKKVSSVTTSSQPTRYENNSVIWEWSNVGKGDRKTIGVIMPLNIFPQLLSSTSPSDLQDSSSDGSLWWLLIIVAIGFIAILLIKETFDYGSPSLSTSGDRDITRHINMDCPNDKSRLDKKTIKGTTIDFCDICGGCFFDKREIESLIKSNVDEKDLNTNKTTKFSEERKLSFICPKCDGDMKRKERIHGKDKLAIYVCEDCDGIWLNKGDYQIIKDKRLEQEKEEKKRKDEGEDYHPIAWWFFYPYIHSTGAASHSSIASYGGGSFGGGGSSVSTGVSSCVSCACVSACACACACAGGGGGGAAGCAPKNKLKQIQLDRLYPKQKAKI